MFSDHRAAKQESLGNHKERKKEKSNHPKKKKNSDRKP